MVPRRLESRFPANDRVRPFCSIWLTTTMCLMAAAGCEEETRNVGKRPESRALEQTGIAVDSGENPTPRAQVPAKAPVRESGPIISQQTADIRDAGKELKQGGAQVATTKITAKDYITLQGNAYVTMMGQTAINNMRHAMDLYHAENDRYPKDYDEFMAVIIKANNIALPQLPPYQKYGYDENEHKLIILEYPDLKNQPGPR